MGGTGVLVTPAELRPAVDAPAGVTDDDLQTLCDAAGLILLPLLTTEDHSDPALHANCHEAGLTVAVQLWQSRSAPGGQLLGTDFGTIPTPHLGGPGLVSRVRGMLGKCEPMGGAVIA